MSGRQNYEADTPVTNKIVMGYFANWAIYGRKYQVTDMPADVLTHVHYAFFNVNAQTFKIQISDSWADTDKRYTTEEQSVFGPFPVDTWNDAAPMLKQEQEQQVQVQEQQQEIQDISDYQNLPKENWETLQQNDPSAYKLGYYGNFKRLFIMRDFKMKHQGAKLNLIASVGGWTFSNNYAALIGSQIHINNFAQSCCDFMEKYHFDGIDLDFEYICFGPQGKYKNPKYEESAQFTNLLQTLRKYFDKLGAKNDKTYSLSITTGCDPEKMRPLEWHKISQICTYVVLMTYDYAGNWDDVSAHQSPVFYNPKDPRKVAKTFNINASLQFLKNQNISLSNFLMGSPAYGRSFVCKDGIFTPKTPGNPLQCWEKANLDYNAIVSQNVLNQFQKLNTYFAQNQDCCLYDEVAKAAYFQNDQDGNVVTYDSVRSLQDKLDIVFDEDMAGIFFWELSGDVRYYQQKDKSLIYSAADYCKENSEDGFQQIKSIKQKGEEKEKLQQQQEGQESCTIF